jgi:hypothetical protein
MKIFNDEKKYGYGINFVDHNNCFVGFRYEQNCCEEFGYKISKKCPKTFEEIDSLKDFDEKLMSEYSFDTSFELSLCGGDDYHEKNAATFRAVDKNSNEIFITIWNNHNGYYSHGWKFSKDGKEIRSGDL